MMFESGLILAISIYEYSGAKTLFPNVYVL
jgi:hypothetical protein